MLSILALLCTGRAHAQVGGTYVLPDVEAEGQVTPERLEHDIEFLSGSMCNGRGSGQKGMSEAAFWISRQFRQAGLLQMGRGGYFQTFISNGIVCRNIIGMLPASDRGATASGRYILVTAHYDNLGTLADKVYPGADSNASGVAAMTGLARMFSFLRGRGILDQNIIFVALDAKQLSMAGSQDLWSRIQMGRITNPRTGRAIAARDISLMVNLDILGGTSAPLTPGREDYIMLLGGGRFNSTLQSINRYNNINLQIGTDYYGSTGFTDMFLNRVSDQKVFREHGVLGVMFTSGITMDTNRVTDVPEKINYEVLNKRVRLIFHWIERMMFLHR